MTNNFSKEIDFLEPYGHTSIDTKIERYWKSSNGPVGLNRERILKFDTLAGITYSPMKYFARRFELDQNLPTEEWVTQKLLEFIRTEFASHNLTELPENWPPNITETIYISDQFLEKFLFTSESIEQVVVNSPIGDSPQEMAESIYEILCHPIIGSKKNRSNNDCESFVQKIIPAIENKSRLLFIIPGFPFKDQNLFRVPFDASIPDLGEIAFMIRLHRLTQALYQVHPYGTDVVILSDGELYCDIFNISKDKTKTYLNRMKTYRNRLNLQGTVSFISLKELIDRSSENSKAWEVAKKIKLVIKHLLEKGDGEVLNSFQILVSGMKWNSESLEGLKDIDHKICYKLLRGQTKDIEEKYIDIWQKYELRAIEAALEYASINLMLRWLDLISKFFPGSIRGTVHPKRGQFSLSGSGGAYAWNGVAWSKDWPVTIDDIKIEPYLALSDFKFIKQVKFEHSGLPIFFTLSNPNKNIFKAKSILAPQGWKIDEIFGREFTLSDQKAFTELGINDAFYSWEREIQSENYFESLLQFRLKHYSNYGFGVHGIWIHEKLVGQFGLQVFDEDKDQVEFAIFLGKEFSHKGIGSKLTKYLLQKCKSNGIECLYGVVRPNNPEGLALIKKIGGSPIKAMEHFSQEAIVYKIVL